ncbi:MAG TPA: hypothetical protein VN476_16990 [Pyrinomonadaceae bacterium]|nr:hypothetical protein [Pyrinomonadaceae bacterium]
MPANSNPNLINDIPPADGEFEELAIAEDEFLDAYVRNELAAEERILFENAMRGSASLRNRLHFARLLLKETLAAPQPLTLAADAERWRDRSKVVSGDRRKWFGFLSPSLAQPAFRLALAGCVLVVLLSGAGLLTGWLKLRSESQQLAAERAALEQQRQALEKRTAEQQSRSEQLTAEILREKQQLEADRKKLEELKGAQIAANKTQSQTLAGSVATLFLAPGSTRGSGDPAELSVPMGTSRIRLELGVESVGFPQYRAVIKDSRNSPIYQQRLRSSRSSRVLSLLVPASSLPPGKYVVELTGLAFAGSAETIDEYPFSVSRKQQ